MPRRRRDEIAAHGLVGVAMLTATLGCGPRVVSPAWDSLAPPPLPENVIAVQLLLPADAAALRRIRAAEEQAGSLDRRRDVLAYLNRQMLMTAPDDALVPELFDFVAAMATRMEARTISTQWASYLYTTYQRDLSAQPPTGRPRRTPPEIEATLDGYVRFYSLRVDPRAEAAPGANASELADPEQTGFEALQQYRDQRRRAR